LRYNILGAVLWASVMVSAAYGAGKWVDLEQVDLMGEPV
jgi:membrane protein DedA with SNARE-associated domain